jgi:hypothetical protein
MRRPLPDVSGESHDRAMGTPSLSSLSDKKRFVTGDESSADRMIMPFSAIFWGIQS